jgi:hypothetical protein
MRARVPLLVVAWFLAGSDGLLAQTSVYGIRGLGFPGRMTNSRGRALGGGPTLFDPGSTLNPAAVAGYGSATVDVMVETDLRDYTVDTVSAGGLTATQFPLAQLGLAIGHTPLSFALSYGVYTDRSYDIQRSDTLELRGAPVGYEERTTSRGGVSDIRAALAYRIRPSLRVGAAVHLLTGSAKLSFSRTFADSAYRPYAIEGDESVKGFGVSAGVIWAPLSRVAVGVTARSDTKATLEVDSVPSGEVDLPLMLAGGIQLGPFANLRWSSSAVWRSWSNAQLVGAPTAAFDTWEVGTGLEFGGPESGESRFPIRAGVRYATLPFSPTAEQPHELALALGVGGAFSQGRGLVDLTAERVMRRGAGASENAWQISWTITVRP